MNIRYLGSYNLYVSAVDRRRGIAAINHFEDFKLTSDKDSYNVIFVGSGGDIAEGLYLKKLFPRSKLIFDYANHYLQEDSIVLNLGRPLANFGIKKYRYSAKTYKQLLLEILNKSDLVICSSHYQNIFLKKLGICSFVITDYFEDDFSFPSAIPDINHDQFFWEGQSFNFKPLLKLAPTINVFKEIPISINADPTYDGYLNNKYFAKSTMNALEKSFDNFAFTQWSPPSVNQNLLRSNIGLLPLNSTSRMSYAKPENRLILFWRFGVYTLASPNHSHLRLKKKIGFDFICTDMSDWQKKIHSLRSESDKFGKLRLSCKEFADHFYSKSAIMKRWERAFATIL